MEDGVSEGGGDPPPVRVVMTPLLLLIREKGERERVCVRYCASFELPIDYCAVLFPLLTERASGEAHAGLSIDAPVCGQSVFLLM